MTQSRTPGRTPYHIVVTGVSGVGKSTVAQTLASRLGLDSAEGDAFHPQANIDKMSAGQPLDDADRMPWLRSLAGWLRDRDAEGRSTVMTCSALKRRYRDVLRSGAPATCFVQLVGDQATLRERMASRQHFMPPALLASQFDALEPLKDDEAGVTVDVTEEPDQVVANIVERLGLG
ncbi:MAG: gluconokinase [Nocardioidaceae bacterium]